MQCITCDCGGTGDCLGGKQCVMVMQGAGAQQLVLVVQGPGGRGIVLA
jgi:hypothetical protein